MREVATALPPGAQVWWLGDDPRYNQTRHLFIIPNVLRPDTPSARLQSVCVLQFFPVGRSPRVPMLIVTLLDAPSVADARIPRECQPPKHLRQCLWPVAREGRTVRSCWSRSTCPEAPPALSSVGWSRIRRGNDQPAGSAWPASQRRQSRCGFGWPATAQPGRRV